MIVADDARERAFAARVSDRGAELERRGPRWLADLRRASRARFDTLGLASAGTDGWSTRHLAALATFEPASAVPAPVDLAALPDAAREIPDALELVFVDGRPIATPAGLPSAADGLWITSLSAALVAAPERLEEALGRRAPDTLTAIAALGAALAEDGAVVVVPPGMTVDRPIHIMHVASGRAEPTAIHTRSVLVASRSSHVRVLETHFAIGPGSYWTNALTEVGVGENASVEHYRIQLEGPRAFHSSSIESRQAAASRYSSHRLDLGAGVVRHDLTSILDGAGAEAVLDALWIAGAEQHVTHSTVLDHAREHTASRELYKGVLAGRARGTFHGQILVRPDAQKIDAKQSNPNLLLSDGALAHTRPQLEIRADDVKCTHGATIGRLDEDAIFYLRSRGIEHTAARRLLIRAFAGEVLDRMPLAPVRHLGERLVDAALRELRG